MNKKEEINKNKLDMKYTTLSQKHNIYLTLITITVVGFVGTFIIRRQYWLIGALLGSIIVIFGYIKYKQTQKEMEEILKKLDKI